jgi:phosphatidylglycerol:prolipoprotein diacylglycerol transferase
VAASGWHVLFGFAELLHDPLVIFHSGKAACVSWRTLGVLSLVRSGRGATASSFFDTIDFVAPLIPIGLGLGHASAIYRRRVWGRHTGCRGA